LLRADSAFYNASVVKAALTGGAEVSVTVRQNKRIRAAITAIADDAWSTIEYTDAIFDEDSHQWISGAEVAETPFTAFTSKPKSEQVTALWSCAASRTSALTPRLGRPACLTPGGSTRSSPLHPSSSLTRWPLTRPPRTRDHRKCDRRPEEPRLGAPAGKFAANAGWLVQACIAFNLTRATT